MDAKFLLQTYKFVFELRHFSFQSIDLCTLLFNSLLLGLIAVVSVGELSNNAAATVTTLNVNFNALSPPVINQHFQASKWATIAAV